ncbi:ankyrin repeat-containing domain protein [Coprinopsis sp. MPI-PUGE-AT-0042]|nr:ankyrin repeat-containing domain protein [Coprinopsis sp. MPI-PUGE-AT-0042]
MGNSFSWSDNASQDASANGANRLLGTGPSVVQSVSNTSVHDGSLAIAGRDLAIHHSVVNHTYIVAPAAPREPNMLQLLCWLSAINFRVILMDNLAKCSPGTVLWFIQSEVFQKWATTAGGVIWGTGIPGAGKTILASAVISYLHALERRVPEADICICFAFCRYTERLSVQAILAAMVRQILERHPRLVTLVHPMRTRHELEGTWPDQNELVGILVAMVATFDFAFFVLDGLDEALDEVRFDLLTVLTSLDARFCITSRPLRSLESEFPMAQHFQIAAHPDDIRSFILERVAKYPALKQLLADDTLKDQVVSTVQESSGGMFLHATLQLETLQPCLSVAGLKLALKSFPAKIEDIYAQTMQRILDAPEPRATLGKRLIIWIVFAREILSIDDLRYALATCPRSRTFDPDDLVSEEVLMELCHGLAHTDASRNVRLIHYTAKDTLATLLLKLGGEPHLLLLEACITHLRRCNFGNVNFRQLGQLYEAFQQNPLLKYAYLNWHEHYRMCLSPATADLAVQDFIGACVRFPLGDDSSHGSLHHPLRDCLSALHLAAQHNLSAVLKVLVTKGLGVNLPTTTLQQSPLIIAAQNGCDQAVRYLLQCTGVNVNSQDLKGTTALIAAAQQGDLAVVEMLLQTHEISHLDVLGVLLRNPLVDVNLSDKMGRTTLIWALSHGDCLEIVDELLRVPNLNIEAADNDGWTALFWASHFGCASILTALIQSHNSDVNAMDKTGQTVLIRSLGRSNSHPLYHPEIVDIIIRTPTLNANAADVNGWTALIWASKTGNHNIVAALLKLPSTNVNATSKHGCTALMYGSEHGYDQVVDAILGFPGVDVHCIDFKGRSALAKARLGIERQWNGEMKYEKIIQRLVEVSGL